MVRFLGVLGFLALGACASQPTVMPGPTGAAQIALVEAPSGQDYVYVLEFPQIGVRGQVNIASTRVSNTRMRYTGVMSFPVTADTLAEMTVLASEMGLEMQGDVLRGSFNYVSDNRGRTLEGRFFGDRFRYDPHDCFATPGVCQYAETANGETEFFVSVTSELDGVWQTVTAIDETRSETTSTEREVEVYSLDEGGVILEILSLFVDEGEGFAMRLTRLQ